MTRRRIDRIFFIITLLRVHWREKGSRLEDQIACDLKPKKN